LKPCVAGFPASDDGVRLAITVRVYYREKLFPLIANGSPTKETVAMLCVMNLRYLDGVDVLELDNVGIFHVRQFKFVWMYLSTLVDPSLGLKYKDYCFFNVS